MQALTTVTNDSSTYYTSVQSSVRVKNTFIDTFWEEHPDPSASRRVSSCPPVMEPHAMETAKTANSWEGGIFQEPAYWSYPSADMLMPIDPRWVLEPDDDEVEPGEVNADQVFMPDMPTSSANRQQNGSQESPGTETYEENSNYREARWSDINDDPDSATYADYQGPVTTMMIRNIPCRCTIEKVLSDIDALGYAGTYDFFYLPQTRKRSSNLGYAFINFRTSETARHFESSMVGHRFCFSKNQPKSSKICAVSPAAIQGLENNERHFLRSTVVRTSRSPCFFFPPDSGETQQPHLDETQSTQQTQASTSTDDPCTWNAEASPYNHGLRVSL